MSGTTASHFYEYKKGDDVTPTLSDQEIYAVTGYKRPADRLRALQRQGFYRARFSRTTGQIILERAHYDAVCAGAAPTNEPRVRPPQQRMRA